VARNPRARVWRAGCRIRSKPALERSEGNLHLFVQRQAASLLLQHFVFPPFENRKGWGTRRLWFVANRATTQRQCC
jgi:hypothetical protein